jgi:hypothetical protein
MLKEAGNPDAFSMVMETQAFTEERLTVSVVTVYR